MSRGIAIGLALWALSAVEPRAAAAAPPGSPWGPAYFPNVPLVTHEGKPVRFYDDLVKDKVVVISFIFTRCGASCPLMTANMVRVQKILGPRVGREIFLYSITLDPEHDTPEVLEEYGELFGAGPGWWFLSGRGEDIDRLRAKLGDRNTMEEHAPQILLGNDLTGQWKKHPALVDPEEIARAIGQWASPRGEGGNRREERGEPSGRGADGPRASSAGASR